MAFTFDNQDNPISSEIGKVTTEATIITTSPACTRWQIRPKQDLSNILTVYVSDDPDPNGTVLAVTSTRLDIILPFRQKHQVRVFVGSWGTWTDFKTRDKSFGLPAAISDLETTGDGTSVIVVSNSSSQVETVSGTGTQVVNSKKMYNDVSSITQTSRGATIVTR